MLNRRAYQNSVDHRLGTHSKLGPFACVCRGVTPTAFLHAGACFGLAHAWCTDYDLKQGCCAGNELEADWIPALFMPPKGTFNNHMPVKIRKIPEA